MDCARTRPPTLAVLGQERDAVLDRLTRGLDVYLLFALDLDGAAVDRVCAEDRAHDLAAARADQPGKAEDLSAVCFEGYILQHAGLLQMLDLEHRLSALYADLLRELVVQRTAYHRGDQGSRCPSR